MKFRLLVTLGALATLAGVSVFAQIGPTLRVSVPFEFTVNSTVLPAGEYSIRNSGIGNLGVLAIESSENQHAVLFTGTAASRNTPVAQSSLEFHRYGNSYFLADIWWAEGGSGLELPKSRNEKEVAKTASAQRPERVVLMASR